LRAAGADCLIKETRELATVVNKLLPI